jgi:ribosomal protein L32
MKGPLHVIRRRRSERPTNETDAAQGAAEAPTDAQPAVGHGPAAPAPAATSEAPPASEIPAGQEPVPTRPSFRDRGRLRRRLRYLRRVRELGFRDLGGLVFDQHRFSRVNEELVRGKLAALAAVDRELRALEHALDDRRSITELREPGISVCPRCGALHGSDARFCPSCGVPVRGPLAIAEVGEAASLSVGEIGAITLPAASAPPAAASPPPPAPEPDPPRAAPPELQPTATDAEPSADGDQATQVMRAVDHDADGGPEAVAQPSGERREP